MADNAVLYGWSETRNPHVLADIRNKKPKSALSAKTKDKDEAKPNVPSKPKQKSQVRPGKKQEDDENEEEEDRGDEEAEDAAPPAAPPKKKAKKEPAKKRNAKRKRSPPRKQTSQKQSKAKGKPVVVQRNPQSISESSFGDEEEDEDEDEDEENSFIVNDDVVEYYKDTDEVDPRYEVSNEEEGCTTLSSSRDQSPSPTNMRTRQRTAAAAAAKVTSSRKKPIKTPVSKRAHGHAGGHARQREVEHIMEGTGAGEDDDVEDSRPKKKKRPQEPVNEKEEQLKRYNTISESWPRKELPHNLRRCVLGQDEAIAAIIEELVELPDAFILQPARALLLNGPSMVGKTLTMDTIARLVGVYRTPAHVCISGTTMQTDTAVARIVGADPGYLGFGNGESLMELLGKAREYAYENGTIVMLSFDEIDKIHLAYPNPVINSLMDIMEKGRFTPVKGSPGEIFGLLIVMTGNFGEQEVCENAKQVDAHASMHVDPVFDHSPGPSANAGDGGDKDANISMAATDASKDTTADVPKDGTLSENHAEQDVIPMTYNSMVDLIEERMEEDASWLPCHVRRIHRIVPFRPPTFKSAYKVAQSTIRVDAEKAFDFKGIFLKVNPKASAGKRLLEHLAWKLSTDMGYSKVTEEAHKIVGRVMVALVRMDEDSKAIAWEIGLHTDDEGREVLGLDAAGHQTMIISVL